MKPAPLLACFLSAAAPPAFTARSITLSGFQVVAVPEPSGTILLGAFVLLGIARRRR